MQEVDNIIAVLRRFTEILDFKPLLRVSEECVAFLFAVS